MEAPSETAPIRWGMSSTLRPCMKTVSCTQEAMTVCFIAFNADTGVEQFAYVPKHVFDHLRDLKSPAYSHKFYVDLTPSVKQMSSTAMTEWTMIPTVQRMSPTRR